MTYRPTLYDFVAFEALKFYTSGEQAAAKPQDVFEVSADSPIFAPADQFILWKPDTTDTDSPVLKAIRLYQELLRFHQNDKEPGAFIDADIERLKYGYNTAFGEAKDARYRAALEALINKWADHPLSALALHNLAELSRTQGDWVEAHKLAQRGEKLFPNTPGGNLCHNLVAQIEARSPTVTTERIWNQPFPKIEVRYRNITQIHFRAVRSDWSMFLQKQYPRPEHLNDKERKALLAKAPDLQWSAKLPPTADFKERVEELPTPDKLKPGFYFIIASPDPEFGADDNQVTYADVWVSDLALVVRNGLGQIQGFVLDALSGEPVAGADVDSWYLNNQSERVANPRQVTDENGFFSFQCKEPHRGNLIRARHKGREVASQQEYGSWKPEPPLPDNRTILFTDRALYRPGQTINYKGICLHVDTQGDNYRLLPGQTVTVVFNDPNGKEIEKRTQRCNDFGSFSGSFTAPRDRLMGSMHIAVHLRAGWGRPVQRRGIQTPQIPGNIGYPQGRSQTQ